MLRKRWVGKVEENSQEAQLRTSRLIKEALLRQMLQHTRARHAQCFGEDLIMLAVQDYETFQALLDTDEMGENNRPAIARAPATAAPNYEKDNFLWTVKRGDRRPPMEEVSETMRESRGDDTAVDVDTSAIDADRRGAMMSTRGMKDTFFISSYATAMGMPSASPPVSYMLRSEWWRHRRGGQMKPSSSHRGKSPLYCKGNPPLPTSSGAGRGSTTQSNQAPSRGGSRPVGTCDSRRRQRSGGDSPVITGNRTGGYEGTRDRYIQRGVGDTNIT